MYISDFDVAAASMIEVLLYLSISCCVLPPAVNDLNMVVGVHGCVPSSDERSCIADIPD